MKNVKHIIDPSEYPSGFLLMWEDECESQVHHQVEDPVSDKIEDTLGVSLDRVLKKAVLCISKQ